jgi:hypothetical protein
MSSIENPAQMDTWARGALATIKVDDWRLTPLGIVPLFAVASVGSGDGMGCKQSGLVETEFTDGLLVLRWFQYTPVRHAPLHRTILTLRDRRHQPPIMGDACPAEGYQCVAQLVGKRSKVVLIRQRCPRLGQRRREHPERVDRSTARQAMLLLAR